MNDAKTYFGERIGRFGRVRRGLVNAAMAYALGVIGLGVGIAALLLLSGWISNAFVNVGLALAALVTLVVVLVRLCVRWERRRSVLSEAFHLEALAGDLNSRVISAVDFLEKPEPTPLMMAVVETARKDLERPFEEKLDRTTRNRVGLRFAVLLVAFLAVGLTDRFGFVRLGRTVWLSAMSVREILLPTQFEVFPGGQHVYRVGTKVETGIRFTRFGYPEVTMLTTVGDEKETRKVLPVDATRRVAVTLQPDMERAYRIRFAFGKRVSDEMNLVFAAPPIIENMQTELVYPLYTRLVPKETEGLLDRITALPGTRINLGFSFNKALNWAVLTFDNGEKIPLDVMGRFASVSFVHTQERSAKLQVEDVHGFGLEVPHGVAFGLMADNPPKLIVPKWLKEDMPCVIEELPGVGFGVRVEDDYGATKCVLKWRKSKIDDKERGKDGEPIERAFIPPRATAVAAFENIFREQVETAVPGDVFTFWVEAYDNRDPKPQMTPSSRFSIFICQRDLAVNMTDDVIDVVAPPWIRKRGPNTPIPKPPGENKFGTAGAKPRPEKGVSAEKRADTTNVSREPPGARNPMASGVSAALSGAK